MAGSELPCYQTPGPHTVKHTHSHILTQRHRRPHTRCQPGVEHRDTEAGTRPEQGIKGAMDPAGMRAGRLAGSSREGVRQAQGGLRVGWSVIETPATPAFVQETSQTCGPGGPIGQLQKLRDSFAGEKCRKTLGLLGGSRGLREEGTSLTDPSLLLLLLSSPQPFPCLGSLRRLSSPGQWASRHAFSENSSGSQSFNTAPWRWLD